MKEANPCRAVVSTASVDSPAFQRNALQAKVILRKSRNHICGIGHCISARTIKTQCQANWRRDVPIPLFASRMRACPINPGIGYSSFYLRLPGF